VVFERQWNGGSKFKRENNLKIDVDNVSFLNFNLLNTQLISFFNF